MLALPAQGPVFNTKNPYENLHVVAWALNLSTGGNERDISGAAYLVRLRTVKDPASKQA